MPVTCPGCRLGRRPGLVIATYPALNPKNKVSPVQLISAEAQTLSILSSATVSPLSPRAAPSQSSLGSDLACPEVAGWAGMRSGRPLTVC